MLKIRNYSQLLPIRMFVYLENVSSFLFDSASIADACLLAANQIERFANTLATILTL